MSWKNILVEKRDETAIITINRPEVLNALNNETVSELRKASLELEKDDTVKAIIITGQGEKAFVAGADITFMSNLTPLEARDFGKEGQETMRIIENLSKPVIAAVNGYALGGGCELAMACDIRIASECAKFGQPEVNLGIMAGFGGTQRLTRLVNPGIAKELLFTADTIDAQTAFRIGLVNHILPGKELLRFCLNMAERIASKGPVAVRLSKEAVNEGLEMDLDKAIAHEADLFGMTFSTEDR
ncbi:MAG TPA: enoyl-CoA hydratase-related protein, partial [Clostridia bacterium]|nr:enoyl-CoA hydratase-related protein [Clostridia bacterium]